MAESDYDPRYLAGVLLFNDQDYFTAHEVWEDLWMEATGTERKFYQGLIQAAVGLCHFENGNLGGAVKLYHSSRAYLEACGPSLLGLDVAEFWRRMDVAYRDLLADPSDRSRRPDPELHPVIQLDPEPAAWPDVDDYAPEEDEDGHE